VTSSDSAAGAWPGGEQLLALEARVRRAGTGLQVGDLLGCWRLEQIWVKGSASPSPFSAGLLRSLQARLELEPGLEGGLLISNAVSLGGLELRFRGVARLLGPRPLLQFSFDRLQLSLAGRVLLQRPLPAPPPRREPFFALIARDPSGWLAARGRGGGLALWRQSAQLA